jgi:SET domain-containing protein
MKIQEHTYKPLPSYLTIKKSPIHGLGLFTKDLIAYDHDNTTVFPVISKGTFIGISHIHSALFEETEFDFETAFEQNEVNYPTESIFNKDQVFPNGLIRTPLGGFINHSDDPNLILSYLNHGCWGIIAYKDINPGEELTLDYKYTPCGVIMNNKNQ